MSIGASGGPERRTEIVVLGSGHEERNSRWADSKRSYNAGYGRIYQAARQVQENPGLWHAVRPYVPPQTRHYVRRIRRLMEEPAGAGASLEE